MSWDGLILKAPLHVSVRDLSNEFQGDEIGTADEIQSILLSPFPDADHSQGLCAISTAQFWLELSYSRQPSSKCDHIGVRTNAGTGVSEVLKSVCDVTQTRLYDAQTGEFADFREETAASMNAFVEFRNRAIK